MRAPFNNSEDFPAMPCPPTLLAGRSLRTKPTASSKDMCVGWPFRDSASTMKRSMPAAAASSKKVIVSGGTAEMSEMYTSNSPRLTLPCSAFHRFSLRFNTRILYTAVYHIRLFFALPVRCRPIYWHSLTEPLCQCSSHWNVQ